MATRKHKTHEGGAVAVLEEPAEQPEKPAQHSEEQQSEEPAPLPEEPAEPAGQPGELAALPAQTAVFAPPPTNAPISTTTFAPLVSGNPQGGFDGVASLAKRWTFSAPQASFSVPVNLPEGANDLVVTMGCLNVTAFNGTTPVAGFGTSSGAVDIVSYDLTVANNAIETNKIVPGAPLFLTYTAGVGTTLGTATLFLMYLRSYQVRY
jgi:hypothetical protein